MNLGDDIKPAGYSKQSKSETKSINILSSLLDEKHVASYLSKNDKTPNHDGNLDLIDDDISIGKLEVQIKTLKAGYSKPSYPIKLTLLAYIRNAQLPFIFIAVDQVNQKAFWKYIDRQSATGLINDALTKNAKQKSIAINFNLGDQISKATYSKWKEIVRVQLDLLKQIESLASGLVVTKDSLKGIEEFTIDKRSEFRSINLFVDELNYLLNNDFRVVKQLFIKDFWKFGIVTFGEITDSRIAYSLFQIELDENVSPIRPLDQSAFQKYIENSHSVICHSGSNPVNQDHKKYAYGKIWEFLKILLDKKILWLNNEVLKNEFLFEIKAKSFRDVNDVNPNVLSLIDFKSQIDTIIPRLSNSQIEIMQSNPYLEGNLFRVLEYIQDDRMKNFEVIKRISPSKLELHSIIDKVNIDDIELSEFYHVFKNYFTCLFDVYEHMIEEYFPNLISELSYKNYYFILFPKIEDLSLPAGNSLKLIQFDLFKLKNTQITGVDKINIDPEIKNLNFNHSNGLILHEGINYQYIESSSFNISSLISDFPIRNGVYALLKENLEKYFKNKQ